MALQDLVQPEVLPSILQAVALVAMATWIFVAQPAKRSHWSLALFLFLRGVAAFPLSLLLRDDIALFVASQRFMNWVLVMSVLVLAYFVAWFPRPSRLARTNWFGFVLVGLAVLYSLVFIAFPKLWFTFGPTPAHFLQSFWPYSALEAGLLAHVAPEVVYGGITFAMAWRLVKEPVNGSKRSVLLVAMALILAELFASVDSTFITFVIWNSPDLQVFDASLLVANVVQLLVGTLLLLAASALVLLDGWRENGRFPRGRAFVLGAPVVAGVLTGLFLDTGAFFFFCAGILGLTFPILLGVAIMRTRLLGVDAKFKFTVKASTLAGIFLAVGFFVTEGATQFLGDRTGNAYLGIGATALLVFAISPLQRFADRVASTAVPNAKPVVHMDANEKEVAYREVVLMAWADGAVTASERLGLERARNTLGLTDSKANKVEQAVVQSLA